jgi:hypothetical protein
VSGPSRSGGAVPTREEMQAISDRQWSAFNARDWEALYESTTPDFTAKTDPRWPGGGEFSGREAQMRFFEQFLDPWEKLRYERVGEPTALNGRMVERGAWIGVGRTTGIEGRLDFTVVTTFEDGLVKRLDFFISHDEALAFAEQGSEPGA